jgi:hypothetical protein
MVPSGNSNDMVHGEVYLHQFIDIVLALLDRYEEIGLEFPEPNEYIRQRQTVFLKNGNIVTAWIYIYNHPTEGLELIESADFLNLFFPELQQEMKVPAMKCDELSIYHDHDHPARNHCESHCQ